MMRYQEKMNISFPSSLFAFSFFIYVHWGCLTIEDNNVIVVLQRQFISHLDRIKSTKHNNNTPYSVFTFSFSCLLCEQLFSVVERKQGWYRYTTTRYPNNVLVTAAISTIQPNTFRIDSFYFLRKNGPYILLRYLCILRMNKIKCKKLHYKYLINNLITFRFFDVNLTAFHENKSKLECHFILYMCHINVDIWWEW